MIPVAIMGHGVVGGGVAEIIATHKQKLFSAVGEDIYIKHILDLREFPDSPFADRFTKNFEDISNDRCIASSYPQVVNGLSEKMAQYGDRVSTMIQESMDAKYSGKHRYITRLKLYHGQ